VGDLAGTEAQHPGWLTDLLTPPMIGLHQFAEALANLVRPRVIKTYIDLGNHGLGAAITSAMLDT
jgi:hypothetical protein